MVTLQKLPKRVIDILSERIVDEMTAFYFYISGSAWARMNGYNNIARYFESESSQEEYHYKRIIQFLSDWNITVKLPSINQALQFSSLEDIFSRQYLLEFELYGKYEKDYLEVLPISPNAAQFISYYVEIQNESVIDAANKNTQLAAYIKTDPGLMLFDEEVFGPKPE